MSIDSSTLTTEHGMRNVSAVVAVGITNGPDTSQASTQTGVGLGVNLGTQHVQAQLLRQGRELLRGEVGDEGVALNRLTLREVHQELVKLSALVILVFLAVLDPLNAGDRAVVQTDSVRVDNSLPVRVSRLQADLLLGNLRAVQEGNHVLVQRAVQFLDTTDDVQEAAQNTNWLVTVLVSVAPRTPVDALPPGLCNTGGFGQDIAESSAQHDLAGGVLLTRRISRLEGVVLRRLQRGNLGVNDGRGVVLLDLLPGCTAELRRDSAWFWLIQRVETTEKTM